MTDTPRDPKVVQTERLFCAALIPEDMEVIQRVLDRFLYYRKHPEEVRGPSDADEAEDRALTPNRWDIRLVEAINQVLEDRGTRVRIHDLDEEVWHDHLRPLIDEIDRGRWPQLLIDREKLVRCGICDDLVYTDDIASHAEQHNPNAQGMPRAQLLHGFTPI